MKFYKEVTLKDGRTCILRSAGENDAETALYLFNLTHEQTDYLLTYPDEKCFTPDSEKEFLKRAEESGGAVEIIAFLDGKATGMAGFDVVAPREKVKHRAEFGISVDKAYWGLGIGRALAEACIECARKAGYVQVELEAVGENGRALKLYESLGFVEYGRNPKGFLSRYSGFQELVSMRLEL